MNFLPKARANDGQRMAEAERELIRKEAKIGGLLFGDIPKGHRREFFCLNEHTWIWHEEWLESGQRKVVTTRYEVRPDVILKSQQGQPFQSVSKAEASNLYLAASQYIQKFTSQYSSVLNAA